MDNKVNILIISEEKDNTTDKVIKWIKYFGGNCLRLNDTSKLKLKSVSLGDFNDEVSFLYNNEEYKLSQFTGYWYRRGRLNFTYPMAPNIENSNIKKNVQRTIDIEYTYLNNYIYSYFEKKKSIRSIGSIFDNKTNKITNLLKARACGLLIPETEIVSTKEQLISFKKRHKHILNKPIYQSGFFYENEKIRSHGLSSLINEKDINDIPEQFMYSLVQGYVPKKYELRIFYLNGECFSSAIMSQLDEQTKIDFRNYNWKKPNRTPPFKLPLEISLKIKNLMDGLKMNSGSIDMIVTPKNEYVFLEVNPVGLFWQVSYPCNYYLEKKVATYLCGI